MTAAPVPARERRAWGAGGGGGAACGGGGRSVGWRGRRGVRGGPREGGAGRPGGPRERGGGGAGGAPASATPRAGPPATRTARFREVSETREANPERDGSKRECGDESEGSEAAEDVPAAAKISSRSRRAPGSALSSSGRWPRTCSEVAASQMKKTTLWISNQVEREEGPSASSTTPVPITPIVLSTTSGPRARSASGDGPLRREAGAPDESRTKREPVLPIFQATG